MNMTTTVTPRTIVKAMAARDLVICAQEAISWQDKGKLQGTALRSLAARFEAEAGIDEMSALAQAEAAVLREATLRFVANEMAASSV